jgi:hypothetical protein
MATYTLTIPAGTLTRISNSLDKLGYKFDPTSALTDAQQRVAFFKSHSIQVWINDIFNYERSISSDWAQQASSFQNPTDITIV